MRSVFEPRVLEGAQGRGEERTQHAHQRPLHANAHLQRPSFARFSSHRWFLATRRCDAYRHLLAGTQCFRDAKPSAGSGSCHDYQTRRGEGGRRTTLAGKQARETDGRKKDGGANLGNEGRGGRGLEKDSSSNLA